jgi:hypothetical protein
VPAVRAPELKQPEVSQCHRTSLCGGACAEIF